MRYLKLITVFIFVAAVILFGWTVYQVAQRDVTPPVITDTLGQLSLSVSDPEEALLQGLQAKDDRDGDLTENILIENISTFVDFGTCKVTYVVFDNSNNFSRLERLVTYADYQSPRLSLSEPLMYKTTDTVVFSDRIHLTDCIEGSLDHKVKIDSSNVANSMVGTYIVGIQAENRYADHVAVRVPLNIVEHTVDALHVHLSEYLIYTKNGEKLDPLSYVTSVTDSTGHTVVNPELTYSLDLPQEGGGQIVITATDPQGRTGVTFLTVIVEDT